MKDDLSPLSSDRDITAEDLDELKRERTSLRKRKRILEGARTYLGERADPALLTEVEDVRRRLEYLNRRIKSIQPPDSYSVSELVREIPAYVGQALASVTPVYVRRGTSEGNYIPLEEVGTLELIYSGSTPSLHDFCVFNLELHQLVNDVALSLIREYSAPHILGEISRIHFPPYSVGNEHAFVREFPSIGYPLISVRIDTILVGSFEELLSFDILAALANPDVRAVLQNLVANVVWIMGSHLGTVVKGKLIKPKLVVPQLDIGSNLRAVLLEYLQHSGESVKIELVQDIPNQGTTRLTIQTGDNSQALTAADNLGTPQLSSLGNHPD